VNPDPLTPGPARPDLREPFWRIAIRANGAIITDTSLCEGDTVTVTVNGRLVATVDGSTDALPMPDCRTCLDSGWLPVAGVGDVNPLEWVEPCTCRPGMTHAEAADLAARGTGCRIGWTNPAGSADRRPYLYRPTGPPGP
jgi:hypothetical protein